MNTLSHVLYGQQRLPTVMFRQFKQCPRRLHAKHKERMPRTAVLMVYTGGPKCIEEIPCFTKRVLLDKHLAYGHFEKSCRLEQAEKVIPQMRAKYEAIVSKTPQFDWMRMQAKLVQERLDLMCLNTAPHRTYIGCQFVKPSISDALKKIGEMKSVQNILVLPMYPQYSCGLTGGCFNAIYRFYRANPIPEGVKWALVDSWATTYSLIKNTAYFIRKELAHPQIKKHKWTLILGARPMPPQATLFGDFYAYLVGATALHIAKQLDGSLPYSLAWHDTPLLMKWFQPTVTTVIKDYAAKGRKFFMLAPISTVVENLVTSYDYDVHIQQKLLPGLGSDLKLLRISAPNASGYFINAVVEVCKEALTTCHRLPLHLTERCVLCANPDCAKYKVWCKHLLQKHMGPIGGGRGH